MNKFLVCSGLILTISIVIMWYCTNNKKTNIEKFSSSQQRKSILDNINNVLNNITQRVAVDNDDDEQVVDDVYISNSA